MLLTQGIAGGPDFRQQPVDEVVEVLLVIAHAVNVQLWPFCGITPRPSGAEVEAQGQARRGAAAAACLAAPGSA